MDKRVIAGIVVITMLVLLASVFFLSVAASSDSARVVIRVSGLEPGKEVASPAIAYIERHDDFPPERVTDYFEIVAEGDTVMNVTGERLRLVVVQPPVYANGSVYEKADASSTAYLFAEPAPGILFFNPTQTTFEVDLSGCKTSTLSVEYMSALIEDEIQLNQNNLEDARSQQSISTAASNTDNEADSAYYEHEAKKYEKHSANYANMISQYVDLLTRVHELDNSDTNSLIEAYKQWCILSYREA